MIAIAHFIAVSFYVGAVALAAAPFARPIRAPVRGVVVVLGMGLFAHGVALVAAAREVGQLPLIGLGPALSFAAFALVATLLVVEIMAGDVTLTLLAAPLAALVTTLANVVGLESFTGGGTPASGAWLVSHIALSFFGIAAFATAAAAGTIYLVEHRQLKSRRFDPILRFFPPLSTLDRVNQVGVLAAWLALTLGIALAVSYSVAHQASNNLQLVWGLVAWAAVTGMAIARLLGALQARRAALATAASFAVVVALYLAFRLQLSGGGVFL